MLPVDHGLGVLQCIFPDLKVSSQIQPYPLVLSLSYFKMRRLNILFYLEYVRPFRQRIRKKAFRLHTRIYTVLRIFCINGTKLAEVSEQQFPLESEIQRLIEANLHDIFELECVKSEFELQDFMYRLIVCKHMYAVSLSKQLDRKEIK